MTSNLDNLIQVGNDITALKYYSIAAFTVLVYDYLLTLADEIEYTWSGKKSWTFWLFIFNRYFPITYQVWQTTISYAPYFDTKVCNKTAFYSILAFGLCTLVAQIALTARIYAITTKNVPIAIGFAVITTSQFVLGMWMTILAAKGGALLPPPMPLDAYHLCVFIRHRTLEVAYTSISLLYDFLAFSLIIFLAMRSRIPGLRVPNILDIIAKDATRYFLVIFTSHLVFELTLSFGRESIQLLPAAGILVYLPVMISRIMLSLRKAGASQEVWSLAQLPTDDRTHLQLSGRPLRYAVRQDSVLFDTSPEP